MKLLKNLLLIIFPIILIEILSQVVFLFYGEQNKYSILFKVFSNQISQKIVEYRIDWDFSKNKMKPGVYQTDKGIEYIINSKGFRGNEFKTNKNKIRILSLGGSTTIGLESAEEKTYPYQLELLLNTNKKNYEVINMGFPGKSLNFIKNLYFLEAANYNPDFIIIYSNRNSLMYDSSYINPKFSNVIFIKLNYFLQENIMTYRLMFKIYKRLINMNLKNGYLTSPWGGNRIPKEYLLNDYKNSLIEIINFSKKKETKVVLVKQAYNIKTQYLGNLNEYSVDELINIYENKSLHPKFNLEDKEIFWLLLGTILNKKIHELGDYENVIIVDPVEKLIENDSNFTDYIHLTPKGNRILAREIYKKIK